MGQRVGEGWRGEESTSELVVGMLQRLPMLRSAVDSSRAEGPCVIHPSFLPNDFPTRPAKQEHGEHSSSWRVQRTRICLPFQPSPTSPSLAARRPASPYPAQTRVFPNTPLTHQTRRHRSLPPQCCSFANSCRLVVQSRRNVQFFFFPRVCFQHAAAGRDGCAKGGGAGHGCGDAGRTLHQGAAGNRSPAARLRTPNKTLGRDFFFVWL